MAAAAAIAVWQLGEGGLIHAKAFLAQHLMEVAWERASAGVEDARPWPWADTAPVARLTFPDRKKELIVLSGAQGASLAFGPGHVTGTALPGTAGVSVIGGHRDTHLRLLQHVETGERVVVERPDGSVHAYQVTGRLIADARQAWHPPATDGPMLALVTCYPFDAVRPGGPLRYIVIAESIPNPVPNASGIAATPAPYSPHGDSDRKTARTRSGHPVQDPFRL